MIEELNCLGHNLADSRIGTIGSVQAVILDRGGRRQYGGSDRRRIGGIVSVRRRDIDDPRRRMRDKEE